MISFRQSDLLDRLKKPQLKFEVVFQYDDHGGTGHRFTLDDAYYMGNNTSKHITDATYNLYQLADQSLKTTIQGMSAIHTNDIGNIIHDIKVTMASDDRVKLINNGYVADEITDQSGDTIIEYKIEVFII